MAVGEVSIMDRASTVIRNKVGILVTTTTSMNMGISGLMDIKFVV